MGGKAIVKKTFQTLLALDCEEYNREIFKAILEARVCPTEFPELGVKDCRPVKEGEHQEQRCRNCWMEAVAPKAEFMFD
jgi:hypothetical protein